VHRHGLLDACIDRFKNIYHSPVGKMDLILGVPTFFVHLTFLRRLECLFTPNCKLNISSISWHSLFGSLLVEWSDSNLLVRSFPLERLRFFIFRSGDRSFVSQHGLPSSWRYHLARCGLQHSLNILLHREHRHRGAPRLDIQKIFRSSPKGS